MTIAFCFLTYRDIENSQLWYNYLKNHLKDVNIYIHSKYPVKNYFFKKYRCKKIVPTVRKEHISIVHATLSLLHEAYLNKDNTHFIFICQATIPLIPFNQLFNLINNSRRSFIKTFSDNCTFRYYALNNSFKNMYEKESFVKQHPNMMLIRKHVFLFLKNTQYLRAFNNLICPDEHYFINILRLNKLLHEVDDRQITFCNYNLNRTQGIVHNQLSVDNMKKIMAMGFLFIRKITNKTKINLYYYKYIYGTETGKNSI
tara:strand:- start:147 stop:917 length:771 start_codon:yes stop_codon:yes gene_type:complete